MIKEITAKTLLASVKQPDTFFGLKYNLNLYRGCQHQCIYCDSRSECYQIEDFNHEVLVKINALDLLRQELPRKRVKGTIGFGSMNDAYMPLEAERNMTGRALQIVAEHGFPVHIITKSDLVLRDIDILADINRVYAAISVTITTADDELGKKVEPGAPLVSRRLEAIRALSARGILAGVTMMPILPFLEDTEDNLRAIVERARDCGAAYILPGLSMTLRDRQRAYYYDQLDRLFPGVRVKYERRFGERYGASANNAKRLEQVFHELCDQYGIPTRMQIYTPPASPQLALF